ncbi:MAG: hypothetical protein IT306_17535 [Chloroflexi bacterium]|nr:hypothetical protein [Chloroflexota bacterium]
MATRRAFLTISMAAGIALAIGQQEAAAGASAAVAPAAGVAPVADVQRASAITEVFGDGQRLTAVALEYAQDIDTSTLAHASFAVDGRTVTRVYANTEPAPAVRGSNGRFVIVELSPDDPSALLWGNDQAPGATAGQAAPPASPRPTPAPGTVLAPIASAGQAPPSLSITPATALVTQAQPLTTADGASLAPGVEPIQTTSVKNLIVDDFQQRTFNDPATGETLNYNLYVPKAYDASKSYPLVLFMHDASVVNTETTAPLIQGLGAVCWASPQAQARHEAFVLAPSYPVVVVDDTYQPIPLFDATVNLVKALTQQYSIDTGRLYATGQSMGAMMALGMNITYPDLFAASYIVAGQWPAEQAAPLAQKKLWVVVSQGDTKAFPGQNAIVDAIRGQGTRVSTATWDGRWTPDQFATAVAQLEADGAPVNYASFVVGSVLPASGLASGNPGKEHINTWRVAYTIDGIRDWMFQQHI